LQGSSLRPKLPVALTLLIVIAAAAVVIAGHRQALPTTVVLALAATFGFAAILPLLSGRLAGPGDWFHPLVMPATYVAFALLAPLGYVVATQRPVAGTVAGDLSLPLIGTLALTVTGFVAGVLVSLSCVTASDGADIPRRWERVLLAGRVLLGFAIVLRTYSTVRGWGSTYGRGSVNFGTQGTVQTVTDFLSVTAPALIVLAQVRLRGTVAGRLDVALFVVFCVLTLVSGSRGELLVPVIFALWVHHRDVRAISLRVVTGACVVVVVLFQGIQGVRAGESPLSSPRAGIERTLTAVGVPLQVTSLTTANVPSQASFRLGDTYIEALKRQLPGAVAVKIWGPPDETGTFALRRILHYNSPDAGLGFALPAESYMNFGVSGALVIALLVGLLFGYAYEKQAGVRLSRASHLLYGFLIAGLPLSLRADAVLQVKAVLYPMLAVALVLGASRDRSSQTSAPERAPARGHRVVGRPAR
jgi:hypothetical protein